MKKLLLIIILSLYSVFIYAQPEGIKTITDDNYNFKIINGDVSWQYVYKTDKSAGEIIEYFRKARVFNITYSDSLNICGNVDKQRIDYKEYGFSTGLVPMYMIGAPCSYNIDIKSKDGKYQVTIFNTVFNPVVGMGMYSSNAQITLNEAAYNYNRNKFKSAFVGMNAAAVLSTVWYIPI